jgi:hypothetical protein
MHVLMVICTLTWPFQFTDTFFLEYAKDMRIIAIKKKNLTVQTTRIKRARWSYIWTNLADRFQVRYYIKWNNQTCGHCNVLWGFREELLSDPVER